jgi:recombination protein RecA
MLSAGLQPRPSVFPEAFVPERKMQVQELETAIHAVQVRFGGQALTRGALAPVDAWPSGVAVADRLSGIGGLPKGRLTVLQGWATSGKLSVALALAARASLGFAQVVVVDPGRSFDPWTLSAYPHDLNRVTAVRTADPAAAGEAAVAVARAGAGFMLLILRPQDAAEADPWLQRLEAATARSGSVVLAVADAAPPALAHASSLSLGLERKSWIWERDNLVGIRVMAACLKNKLAAPGAQFELDIRYPQGSAPSLELPGVGADGAQDAVPIEQGSWAVRSAAV